MVRFLIQKPIGVILATLALVIFSLVALSKLPVSLLPDVDVPKLIIKINYPNHSATEIEAKVLSPIRESLKTTSGFKSIESIASNEVGNIELGFEIGGDMSLAFIEINEKIDQLADQLPDNLKRPQVIKVNSTDIPVLRLQVIPSENESYTKFSQFAETVLKKRLEQIEGVSVVDINGLGYETIAITPKSRVLLSKKLNHDDILEAIRVNNQELGSITVKDGYFEYYLKVDNTILDSNDLSGIPIRIDYNTYTTLGEVASIKSVPERVTGYHLFNHEIGLVMTVHKQPNAKITRLTANIHQLIDQFKADYPLTKFEITQDQSSLLFLSINNLNISLIIGGLSAFTVLFFFLGNPRVPFILGISIPVSLLLSFLIFYLFKISINIISLSGLALGVGMLIDNAIIVIDNITRKVSEGNSIFESCIAGVNEIMSALVSSTLTTLAVFIPLIYLHGLSGALFKDQAIAISAILLMSLLVSFILLPLLYKLFLERTKRPFIDKESKLFLFIINIYKQIYFWVFANKPLGLGLMVAFFFFSLYLGITLPREGIPALENTQSVLDLEWNEPINIDENKNRVTELLAKHDEFLIYSESDLGIINFLMETDQSTVQHARIYMNFRSPEQQAVAIQRLERYLKSHYPYSRFSISDLPNSFDQVFRSGKPYYQLRFKNFFTNHPVEPSTVNSLLDSLDSTISDNYFMNKNLSLETSLSLTIDRALLNKYAIPYEALTNQLNHIFGGLQVTSLNQVGTSTPVTLEAEGQNLDEIVETSFIQINRDGEIISYPIKNFIDYSLTENYRIISADQTGVYQDIYWDKPRAPTDKVADISGIGVHHNLNIDFEGQYFEDREQLKQLVFVLFISALLLYFILAAQFESLIQPLIVICILPLGIGGSLVFLWLTGSSVNIMSGIGMIVMLGIIVNDAILKIDTMNKMWRQNRTSIQSGNIHSAKVIMEVIEQTGIIRLKPILMTSITTILAISPILFFGGLGAELQKSFIYAVIGGLTVGTFTALYFIPVGYFMDYKIKTGSGNG